MGPCMHTCMHASIIYLFLIAHLPDQDVLDGAHTHLGATQTHFGPMLMDILGLKLIKVCLGIIHLL